MPDLPGGDAEALAEYRRAVRALALEVPATVWEDFKAKSDALLARLAEAERLQVRAEDRSHDQFMARKAAEADRDRWLEWSAGRYPDNSPGDVIAAETDGTIVLDDGITTWNPLRALAFFEAERDRLKAALEQIAAGAHSWHGPEPPHSGHVRALSVIAGVARAALAADEEGGSSHDRQGDDRAGVQGAGPDDPEVA